MCVCGGMLLIKLFRFRDRKRGVTSRNSDRKGWDRVKLGV